MIAGKEVKKKLSRKIGQFIEACSLEGRENFMSDCTNRYRFELIVNPAIVKEKTYTRTYLRTWFSNLPSFLSLNISPTICWAKFLRPSKKLHKEIDYQRIIATRRHRTYCSYLQETVWSGFWLYCGFCLTLAYSFCKLDYQHNCHYALSIARTSQSPLLDRCGRYQG